MTLACPAIPALHSLCVYAKMDTQSNAISFGGVFMRRFALAVFLPVLLLLLAPLQAEAGSVKLDAAGFSFELPDMLEEAPVDDAARAEGVLYAAQSRDKGLRFILLARKVRRGGATDAAALVAREGSDENVEIQEQVVADGYEFVLSAETVEDAGEPVTFRLATAVVDGTQLAFFFIDRTGEHADVPRSVVESFIKETGEGVHS